LTSYGYPNNYANSLRCFWTIHAPEGQRIKLNITEFSTESCCDRLYIYDSAEKIQHPQIIATLSGVVAPDTTIYSRQEFITLFFSSDTSLYSFAGFRIGYSAIASPCGFEATASNVSQALNSPNWPGGYPSSTTCEWTVRASSPNSYVQLTITSFETESCCDYLQVSKNIVLFFNSLAPPCGFEAIANEETFIGTTINLRFHTDGSVQRQGFEASFAVPAISCGFNAMASATAQNISSPNYPNPYPNGQNCVWQLNATNGNQVRLIIEEISTETCCDYLRVSEGGVIIEELKGNHQRKIITSQNGSLQLIFHSDTSVNGQGFIGQFMATCGFERLASRYSQTFVSPGYPGRYGPSLNCRWVLRALPGMQVRLDIATFQTETCCDSLEVLDGTNQLALLKGTHDNLSFTSTNGTLNLIFTSDGSVALNGFSASFVALCGFDAQATTTSQVLNSPGYPENYANSLICRWMLTASPGKFVRFTITSFDTESCCDKLKVFDGNTELREIKGALQDTMEFFSTNRTLTLVFQSDSSRTGPGFTASFIVVFLESSVSPTVASATGCFYTLNATTTLGTITSPGYPHSYENEVDCEWDFNAPQGKQIRLIVQTLSTEMCCDYLKVLDNGNQIGDLRGEQSNQTYTSTNGRLTVLFHSDSSVQRAGFTATYQELPNPCGSENYLHAVDADGYLQLPSYPNDYDPNLNCWWTITATVGKRVRLDFVDFSLESCCDFLYIYNSEGQTDNRTLLMGYYSGDSNGTVIYSQSEFVSIKFHTDTSVGKRGFRIKYTAIAPNERCGPHHGYLAVVGLTEEYIQLPTFPNNYNSNLNCWWTVDAPVGKIVRLDFVDFYNLTASMRCMNTSSRSRNESNNSSLTLGRFSGTVSNTTTVYSRGNYLSIHFQTDSSIQHSGFRIQFSAVGKKIPG
uniref:CUB domain-containing protein n=1 Tax=Ciona intestinalis TaxID=7719 RepID=H2XQR0_CIOIN